MGTITVEALRANRLVCDLLGGPFEFIVCDGTCDPVWFTVEGCDLQAVAEDGAGGVYVLVGPQRHVLHVSSQKRAAVIARCLREALALVVACPYWRDLIRITAGNRDMMRCLAPHLERMALEECPDLDQYRNFLRSELCLASLPDPIGQLHRSVTALGWRFTVRAPDGHRLLLPFAGAA
jgi:hypothetical protein